MSRANSREAKAARRSARPAQRPRYPVMPPSTCYGSSIILAACYPELRYAEGIRTWTSPRHAARVIPHAWNVNVVTGEIWDSTLAPEARALAEVPGYGVLEYAEGERTMGPDAFAGWVTVTLEAVDGRNWHQRCLAIEAVGQALVSLPADYEPAET
jgi:hypothetical protein